MAELLAYEDRNTAMYPPLAGWAERVANLVVTLAIAAAISLVPVAAHGVHGALGILSCAVLAGLCAARLPQVAVVAVVFGFLFQNLFVSIFSGFVRGDDDFDIIRAYNFLALCMVWLVTTVGYLRDFRLRPRSTDLYLQITVALLVVLGLYFMVGFVFNGMAAVIYLRNIATPLLLFQTCLVLFSRHQMKVTPAFAAMGMLAAACGLFEFYARDAWLAWTNGYTYWELAAGPNWATLALDKAVRETGHVATGLTSTFEIDFFNSPLLAEFGIRMMRLFGPNMHAISFAYALSFFTLFALFRGRFAQAAVLFVLLFLCNAKGPLIVLALTGVSFIVFRLFGAGFAFALHGLALLGYAVVGVLVGLSLGDYHVLGLMAALHEFPLNPIGYGIGSGGNLSSGFASINWYDAQATGRTPFPVESSVGVLLYQTGIVAFAIVGVYGWIAWRVMRVARLTGNSLQAAGGLALAAIVANGLFQEEAYFSPLGLALYLGLAGMILGAAIRTGAERESIS